jgi:hypothetical protein
MSSCRRLFTILALGLGLVGTIACIAAIFALWTACARLRGTTEAVFGKISDSLIVVQERSERERNRITESAITAESLASNLRNWTGREASERLALQLNVTEKSDRLRVVLQQADDWLALSRSSAELVQQALSIGNASGAQIDTGFADALIKEIVSLRTKLAEAAEVVGKLHECAAAMGEEETRQERIEQAIPLALRVAATLGSIETRFEKFKSRLSKSQADLQELKNRTLKWIRGAMIAAFLLVAWMAAGQAALCCIAWKGLRSEQTPTAELRSSRSSSYVNG